MNTYYRDVTRQGDGFLPGATTEWWLRMGEDAELHTEIAEHVEKLADDLSVDYDEALDILLFQVRAGRKRKKKVIE